MATTTKTLLAYCGQCKIGIGWGALQPNPALGHFANGQFHGASFVEMDGTDRVGDGETNDQFLVRMYQKYVK